MNNTYTHTKTKKWLGKIFSAVAISTLMLSCSDSFLDLDDPDSFTGDKFWVNKSNAVSAVASAYEPIQYQMDGWFGATTGFLDLQARGDETWTVLGEEVDSWTIATFSNSIDNSKYSFGQLYTGIQRANVILYYIDLVPTSELSVEERERLKGEAYFLRGYQYFLLGNHFLEVPLRLIPSQEEKYVGPSSQADIFAQVEKDLKSAIAADLPIKRSAAESGRIEKGAAVMLLAKLYATQHEYAKAKELLEELQKAPYTYDLVPRYEENFMPDGEHNKESIFEIEYGEGAYSWGNGGFAGQGNSLPQWLGSPQSGGWMKLAPSAFIVSEFIKEKKTSEKAQSYNGRNFDERMYTSFFFDTKLYGDARDESADWYDGESTFNQYWDLAVEQKLNKGMPDFPIVNGKEGRFLTKKYTAFFDNDGKADQMAYTPGKKNNIRVMRFAETLLLYAEACYKTNDEVGANQALSKIRERAGLEAKTFSGNALWKEIERQFLLEFYNEGRRFEDLKRWYTADQIKAIFIENKKQGAENFQAKHLYYPIPLTELQTNLLMTQNSAWR